MADGPLADAITRQTDLERWTNRRRYVLGQHSFPFPPGCIPRTVVPPLDYGRRLLELVSARKKEEGRIEDTSGPSRFGPHTRYPRCPWSLGPLPVSVGPSATGAHGVPAVAKTETRTLQTIVGEAFVSVVVAGCMVMLAIVDVAVIYTFTSVSHPPQSIVLLRSLKKDRDKKYIYQESGPFRASFLLPCNPHPGRCATRTPEAQDQQSPPDVVSRPRTDSRASLSPSRYSHSLSLSSTSSSHSSSSLIPIIRSFPQSAHGPFLRRRRESTRACCDCSCSCSLFAESLARPCASDRPLAIPAAPFTTILFPLQYNIVLLYSHSLVYEGHSRTTAHSNEIKSSTEVNNNQHLNSLALETSCDDALAGPYYSDTKPLLRSR